MTDDSRTVLYQYIEATAHEMYLESVKEHPDTDYIEQRRRTIITKLGGSINGSGDQL